MCVNQYHNYMNILFNETKPKVILEQLTHYLHNSEIHQRFIYPIHTLNKYGIIQRRRPSKINYSSPDDGEGDNRPTRPCLQKQAGNSTFHASWYTKYGFGDRPRYFIIADSGTFYYLASILTHLVKMFYTFREPNCFTFIILFFTFSIDNC